MSVSEAEVQMIDQYSKNIDMQDIGLFWQLTLKTIDDLKIVGNENLTLEMYIMQLIHLKDIDINVEPNSISVKAENGDKRKYNYSRRFKPTVDVDSAKATFKNGVLDITINKIDTTPKGKSVKIQ